MNGDRIGPAAPSPPPLPRTWRPLFARVVGVVATIVVLAGSVALALGLPARYHAGDRAAVVVLGAVIASVLLVLVRPRLVANDQGLTVVNLLHKRRISWAEVVGLDLAETASWASLDLDDGSTLAVLALQTADGARFRRAVAEVRALVEARSGQPPVLP